MKVFVELLRNDIVGGQNVIHFLYDALWWYYNYVKVLETITCFCVNQCFSNPSECINDLSPTAHCLSVA